MMGKKILSKNLNDLNNYALKKRKIYQKGKPYPHIVIKNFFDKKFLSQILNEFPDLSKIKSSNNYDNKNEIKFANNKKKHFKKNTKIFFNYLNSKNFIDFIQKLSSINEKLLPDQKLNGGGLHEIKRGGVLKIHTDFNKHPTKDIDRRINVLIYLNKGWKKNYGGNLELWDKNMKKCVKKILPSFNTMVIFSTNDFTNHGHPNPLKCPEEISRKSIATYYFSKGRPTSEVIRIKKKILQLLKTDMEKKMMFMLKKSFLKILLETLSFIKI